MSIAGYWGQPLRAELVEVDAQDRDGNLIHLHATGFLAQVLQHETDHLNGIVYPDRLPEGSSLRSLDDPPESDGNVKEGE